MATVKELYGKFFRLCRNPFIVFRGCKTLFPYRKARYHGCQASCHRSRNTRCGPTAGGIVGCIQNPQKSVDVLIHEGTPFSQADRFEF
jgi:hypothetical protein